MRRFLTRVGGLTSAIEYLYEVNLYELILETHIRYGAPVSCGNVRGSKANSSPVSSSTASQMPKGKHKYHVYTLQREKGVGGIPGTRYRYRYSVSRLPPVSFYRYSNGLDLT